MKLERRLTSDDKAALQSYKDKCQRVKDFTLACLKGTNTGLGLFGTGGTGKSFSIRETLIERHIAEIQPEHTQMSDDDTDDEDEEECAASALEFGYDSYVIHQGRITAKGVIKEMQRFPKSLHLIEDAETLFDSKDAWGVLRQALHSQSHSLHPSRRCTWKTSVEVIDFYFHGSLIIVGNRLLPNDIAEVEAVKTRCPFLNFDMSNDEIIAKMKDLCEKGYKEISAAMLSKDDCYSVLEYMLNVISQDARLSERKLNLRILIAGFRYLALGRLEPSIKWQSMLLDQLKELVGSEKRTRKERIYDEAKIAKEIARKKWISQHEKLVEWCKQTGRNLAWAEADRGSEEYLKGFRAAKTDYSRKSK